MYAYIDGEEWAARACPPLTEAHGDLVDDEGNPFGRVLDDTEETEVRLALLSLRLQPALDLD